MADQRRFESCGDLDRVNTFDGGTAFAFPRTAPTLSSLVGSTPAAVRSTAAGILCLPIGDLSRRGRRSGFASHLMPAMRNLYVRTQNDCPDGSCLICGTTGHTHASLFQGHDPLGLLCHCCLEQPPSAAAEQLRRRAGESLVWPNPSRASGPSPIRSNAWPRGLCARVAGPTSGQNKQRSFASAALICNPRLCIKKVSGTLHLAQETWRPRRPKVPDTFFMQSRESAHFRSGVSAVGA